MTEFDPTPPPLDLPAAPAVLSPDIPLNPPMVGTASPFTHVDGQNRDIILESIRTWIRVSLLPWTTTWQDQLTEWETDAESQLNTWMGLADAYITTHAIAGLSFRATPTDIAGTGTTDVSLTVDQTLRPITLGDLVLDESADGNYGIVTAIVDPTHATVTFLGSLRGPAGLSFRSTTTPIAGTGTTDVVVSITAGRPLVLGDLVLDDAPDGNYGIVTTVIDATHATVTFVGSLIGPQGIQGIPGEPGADGTDGTDGTNGSDGLVTSVEAGAGISVDSTDPAHPVVSSYVSGNHVYTDPAVMNADASVLPSGSIAVLTTGGTGNGTSTWVLTGGKWGNAQFSFGSKDPAVWALLITALNLGVNTNLLIAGAAATEGVNGSHPYWSDDLGAFIQDPPRWRQVVYGAGTAPFGAAVVNDNNTVTVTNAVNVDIEGVAPDFTTDDTDAYEIHLWGELNGNCPIRLQMQGTGLPDYDENHYMEFGKTTQFAGGHVTDDPDFVAPIGTDGFWTLVTDTTGDPTFFDILLRVYHNSSAAGGPGGTGQPVIAYSESVFYNDPAGPVSVMFKRTGTHYYFGNDLVRRGLKILTDGIQHWSGTITVKVI